MPAIQKRVIQNTEFPEAKKAKVTVEDPVFAKVNVIVNAIQDINFVVPGTNANREMLVAMAPAVLGTACDVRHAHQQSVADTFQELFLAEESRLTERVAETQEKMIEINKELATRQATVASAETLLQQKSDELKTKQLQLAGEVQVTRNAETTFKEATSEFNSLQEVKDFDSEEQTAAANLKTESFQVLLEGNWEGDSVPKEHIKALQTFFRKLRVDVSMVAALPLALGRKPDARSEFDSMVVSELEKKVEEKLQDFILRAENNEAAIVAKKAEKDAAEAALADAKAQQKASAEAMLELKAEQKQRAAELAEKKQAVVEQEFEMKSDEADHNERKLALETHQKTLSDLVELLERRAPVPEVAVEETAAEMATDLVPELVQEPAM